MEASSSSSSSFSTSPSAQASSQIISSASRGPALPWELLEQEILPHLPFSDKLSFGRTCRRLARAWPLSVSSIPSRLKGALNDQRMICFSLLTKLNLLGHNAISDAALRSLHSLTTLNLGMNGKITNAGLSSLRNLTSLDLTFNRSISDDGVSPLTLLQTLVLFDCSRISDRCLSKLTNLTQLGLGQNRRISERSLSLSAPHLSPSSLVLLRPVSSLQNAIHLLFHLSFLFSISHPPSLHPPCGSLHCVRLTNLRELDLCQARRVKDSGLSPLTKLEVLRLVQNGRITDRGISSLVNLTSLDLAANRRITSESVVLLTNLTDLNLWATPHVPGSALASLPKLRTLWINSNPLVLDEHLTHLTSLTSLHVGGRISVTATGLTALAPSLKDLHMNGCFLEGDFLLTLTSLQTLQFVSFPRYSLLSFPSLLSFLPDASP